MASNGYSNGTLTPQAAQSNNVSGTSTPRSAISATGSAMIGHSITDPVELWRHADPESTQMHRFKTLINCKYGLDLDHYEDLHKWSVENIADFWSEVWDFVGVQGEKHYKESEVGHIPTSVFHAKGKVGAAVQKEKDSEEIYYVLKVCQL